MCNTLIFNMIKIRTLLIAVAVLTTAVSARAQFADEVLYTPSRTTIKVFASPEARSVKMRLYKDGIGGKALKTIRLKRGGDSLWTATLRGNMAGRFYTFDAGQGECAGLFAKAVGVNGKRGAIIDMNTTDPEGWDDDVRPLPQSFADWIVYEMHHRDYSIDHSSGIVNKGKYLALTEQRAIDHLKRLGVNAVHLLPSFDYASVDETRLERGEYNWGYDPVNYNVPDGSYSTDPYTSTTRIREFKQMVKALHEAGICVILDVVYNHTFDIAGSNFQRLYPDYFYRKTADGSYSNGSGCGNETASEHKMMRQFIVESVRYWVNEYHIDGFRFDLMGVHDIETMNAVRAAANEIDPRILIYGEGWSAGSCAIEQQQQGIKANVSRMKGIAAFSDELRDALRGPFSDDTKGAFLAGIAGSEESLKFGICGAIEHPQIDYTRVNYSQKPWADEPTQMMSYVSCHDDMCLTDRLRASIKNLSQDELIRLDLLAQTAVMTSQGIPFLLSGEEMLRTKLGVRNSFNSSDSINHLDWEQLARYPQVFDYYSRLIQLRKNHPAFRLGSAEAVRRHLRFLPTADCLVAFCLANNAGGDAWKDIYVVLNASKQQQTIALPQGDYEVVCARGVINERGLYTVSGDEISVAPQSALIFHTTNK